MVDGVAFAIRIEARMTCCMFHVKLVKDIILNCHEVHWALFYFHSYDLIIIIIIIYFLGFS